MNWSSLTTTIVSGVISVSLIAATTVLLVTGQPVPSEFPALMTTSAGVAIGGSVLASRNAGGGG